ncbi:hypothetical protein EHV15_24750 [Paenibacillus oralis]|uniref:Uncharacterized protein n=1 Tax=Paenibacillus oralis TaxID=2490856 RepID=A0A3P3U853_9BACL|nr:hypothetical protein [Paenibacillus oralis]RRJ65768.1 hypothetical protein EHV15_24750 [Paenibacillus oralis]
MKLLLVIFLYIGLLMIGLGGCHIYKARQIEGMGALGAGFLGAAEVGLGALIMIISVIGYWIQKWRVRRKLNN